MFRPGVISCACAACVGACGSASARDAQQVSFTPNLISHPYEAASWNGANGGCEFDESTLVIRSAYDGCVIHHATDLIALGYSASYLDSSQPAIAMRTTISKSSDVVDTSADRAKYRFSLLDLNGAEVCGMGTSMNASGWFDVGSSKEVGGVFPAGSYGVGVRSAAIFLEGVDMIDAGGGGSSIRHHWRGHYGATFSHIEIRIEVRSPPSPEPQPPPPPTPSPPEPSPPPLALYEQRTSSSRGLLAAFLAAAVISTTAGGFILVMRRQLERAKAETAVARAEAAERPVDVLAAPIEVELPVPASSDGSAPDARLLPSGGVDSTMVVGTAPMVATFPNYRRLS